MSNLKKNAWGVSSYLSWNGVKFGTCSGVRGSGGVGGGGHTVAQWIVTLTVDWTVNQGDRFENWTISFTPLCLCLSEQTLKALFVNILNSKVGVHKPLIVDIYFKNCVSLKKFGWSRCWNLIVYAIVLLFTT